MKLKEQYLSYKLQYSDTIVLLKSGMFYLTFYQDASLMHSLFGYKIINEKVGFPIDAADKVKEKLDTLSINFIFLEEDGKVQVFSDNQYFFYLKKIEEEKFYNQIVTSLIPVILEKIKMDFHNYEKIKRYLNEL